MYTLSALTVFPDIDRFSIFFGPQMRSKINHPMQGLKPKKLDRMTFVAKRVVERHSDAKNSANSSRVKNVWFWKKMIQVTVFNFCYPSEFRKNEQTWDLVSNDFPESRTRLNETLIEKIPRLLETIEYENRLNKKGTSLPSFYILTRKLSIDASMEQITPMVLGKNLIWISTNVITHRIFDIFGLSGFHKCKKSIAFLWKNFQQTSSSRFSSRWKKSTQKFENIQSEQSERSLKMSLFDIFRLSKLLFRVQNGNIIDLPFEPTNLSMDDLIEENGLEI